MSRLQQLSERYRDDRRRRGGGFVWGGPERAEPLRRSVGGPGLRVLDLGCRDGALTRHYLQGNDAVGVDADEEALARAATLGIETLWADVEEPLPFADETFDVVVAAEILEHLEHLFREGGTWTSLRIEPGSGTTACVGMVLALYLDLLARRARLRAFGRAVVAGINARAEVVDRRVPALREPRPGSLFANYHVTADA